MGKVRKLLSVALLVCVVGAFFASPAYAANIAYSFNLENTGTTYMMYTSASNTKSYASDPATVATTSMMRPDGDLRF